MTERVANLFEDYVASKSSPIDVRASIIDRTTTRGMTPQAIQYLQAATEAGAAAGLTRIDVVAAKGGGHKSHSQGTEWDIRGYNADGSLWTKAQRVAVAEGARQAGADRFGIYRMDKGLGKGTLHLGYSGPGRPAAVWGANGLTSGDASRRFSDPNEAKFLAAVQTGKPLLIASRGPTPPADIPDVPMPRLRPSSTLLAAQDQRPGSTALASRQPITETFMNANVAPGIASVTDRPPVRPPDLPGMPPINDFPFNYPFAVTEGASNVLSKTRNAQFPPSGSPMSPSGLSRAVPRPTSTLLAAQDQRPGSTATARYNPLADYFNDVPATSYFGGGPALSVFEDVVGSSYVPPTSYQAPRPSPAVGARAASELQGYTPPPRVQPPATQPIAAPKPKSIASQVASLMSSALKQVLPASSPTGFKTISTGAGGKALVPISSNSNSAPTRSTTTRLSSSTPSSWARSAQSQAPGYTY